MSNLDWKLEKHPDWYRDGHKMKYLILGSFPPPKERDDKLKWLEWDYEFYYPYSKNHFWKILAEIAEEKKIKT